MKKGDKVCIPIVEKSASGHRLKDCSAIADAKRLKQDFLYIASIDDGNVCIVGACPNDYSSSFHMKDLTLYETIYEIY